jgi:hypothetical protein
MHPAQIIEANDEHRSQLFNGLVHKMFGTELPGNQGFQSFGQLIKSKSVENIRNRAQQHRNPQERRSRRWARNEESASA